MAWKASSAVLLAVVVVSCCLVPREAAGQSCDSALIRRDNSPLSYRDRGDRCEGIYRRRVSAFGAQLISLTAESDLTDLCTSGRPVHMVLPDYAAAAATPIRLQAESLRSELYYRLDTELRSRRSFEWPFDPRCNSEVRLTAPELALIATARIQAAEGPVEALLPIRLAFDPGTPARAPYRALLMPGRRVSDVFVTLWRYDGTARTRVFAERPLKSRPYAPDTPIAIVLDRADVTTAGLYRAVVNVMFDGGEAQTIDFYFVHGR